MLRLKQLQNLSTLHQQSFVVYITLGSTEREEEGQLLCQSEKEFWSISNQKLNAPAQKWHATLPLPTHRSEVVT